MILGVDASNVRSGGTVTHLTELLRNASPLAHGFDRVIVWASSAVLARLEERDWLVKTSDPLLEQTADPFRDRRHALRWYWQRFRLARLACAAGCNVVFVPGGLTTSGFRPIVSMSQNMLPFDWSEARRYGWSLSLLRLALLRIGQARTFRSSEGVIFLTDYARQKISAEAHLGRRAANVIAHGVSSEFYAEPRPQRAIEQCSAKDPLRLIYVSTIDLYKHQGKVVQAAAALHKRGVPIHLTLAGPTNGRALESLRKVLSDLDPQGAFVQYIGPLAYEAQPQHYMTADLCVFASSCENLPIILLEAMAAGMPIACSNRGPMPEVLGDAGIYFDPEQPHEIASAIEQLVLSPELRLNKARAASQRAQQYSWPRSAAATFDFMRKCAESAQSKLVSSLQSEARNTP